MTEEDGHRLRCLSVVLLLATAYLAVLGPFGRIYGVLGIDGVEALGWTTVVIGDIVPTLLGVEFALLVGGLVTGFVGFLVLSTRRRPPWLTFLRVLGTVALLAVVACTVFVSLMLNSDAYVALSPASDSGCRLVARRFSFLVASGGTIGVLRPGSISVDWLTDYPEAKGEAPFFSGDYSLRWESEDAHITLSESETAFTPVLGRDSLPCR